MPFSWPSHKATLVRRSVQRSQAILPTQAQKRPPAVEGVRQEGVIHSGPCAGLETRGSGSEPLLCKGERVPRLIRTEGHGRDQQGGHGNGANGPQAAQSHAKRTNVSQPWGGMTPGYANCYCHCKLGLLFRLGPLSATVCQGRAA